MKLTVDKAVTPASHTKHIREMLKEFRGKYTEDDLLNAFLETFDDYAGCIPEVLKCTVEGFYDPCNLEGVSFQVDIISHLGHVRFDIIHFYTNINLNISTDSCLRSHETFWQK